MCENYKKIDDKEAMKKEAELIWNFYLDTSSMHQINVDNKARSHCKEAMLNPSSDVFEMAQSQVNDQLTFNCIRCDPCCDVNKIILNNNINNNNKQKRFSH